MFSDFRFALRQLGRSPGFAFTALLTIALGIGLNTAMFSVLNTLLLRPLSFPHTEQLFTLDRVTPQNPRGAHSPGDVDDIARASADIVDVAAYRFWSFTVSEPGKVADL